MKQLKIKKDIKKAMPKILMAKKPFAVKTNVKAGGFGLENLWNWVPGLGDGDEK